MIFRSKRKRRPSRQPSTIQSLPRSYRVPAQTLYEPPTSPEYLFQEESIAQRRSWGENLTYYTGIGYLSSAVVGVGKGLVEGMKASEARDTMKLRVNWNEMHGGWICYWGVVAGLATGVLYKTAAGPRSTAVAGAIGGIAVGLVVTGKQILKRYVPI